MGGNRPGDYCPRGAIVRGAIVLDPRLAINVNNKQIFISGWILTEVYIQWQKKQLLQPELQQMLVLPELDPFYRAQIRTIIKPSNWLKGKFKLPGTGTCLFCFYISTLLRSKYGNGVHFHLFICLQKHKPNNVLPHNLYKYIHISAHITLNNNQSILFSGQD